MADAKPDPSADKLPHSDKDTSSDVSSKQPDLAQDESPSGPAEVLSQPEKQESETKMSDAESIPPADSLSHSDAKASNGETRSEPEESESAKDGTLPESPQLIQKKSNAEPVPLTDTEGSNTGTSSGQPELTQAGAPLEPTQPELTQAGAPLEPTQPELTQAGAPLEPTQPELTQAGAPLELTQPELTQAGAPLEPTQLAPPTEEHPTEEAEKQETILTKEQKSEVDIEAFAAEKFKTYEDLMIKKRKYANRPDSLLEMNRLQLVCERIALMSALLDYELKLVRPSSDYERLVMRPLYDRLEKILRILKMTSSFGEALSTLGDAMKSDPKLEDLLKESSDTQVPKPLIVGGYKDPNEEVEDEEEYEGFVSIAVKYEKDPDVQRWLHSKSTDDRESRDLKKFQELSEKEIRESLSNVSQEIRECGRILRKLEGDGTWSDRSAVILAYEELETAQRKAWLFENLLWKKQNTK